MNHPRVTALRRMLVLAIALMTPLAAWADTNALNMINLTGGIATYDGYGVNVGQIEAEGGTPTNHVDFNTNNLFIVSPTSSLYTDANEHATEVASVIISTGVVTRGVAPRATLYSAGAGTDPDLQSYMWLMATQNTASAKVCKVINMSLGTPNETMVLSGTSGGTNYYNVYPSYSANGSDLLSRTADNLARNRGVIFVISAGNNGSSGTNSITAPGDAYNIISVGAVSNLTVGTTSVADFSSRGYLSNGRSKPDIVAPGADMAMAGFYAASSNLTYNASTAVLSNNVGIATTIASGTTVAVSYPGPAQNPVSGVVTDSGTSFAAPMVAGVAARLVQYGNTLAQSNSATDPRVIKAVLLNSATKLPGWTQGTTNIGGVISVTRPLDPNQGAGLLNAGRAFNELAGGRTFPTQYGNSFLGDLVTNNVGWDRSDVQLGLTNIYMISAQSSGELRLTLDWYRDVDTNNNVLGLANLDLMLWSSPNQSLSNMILEAKSISTVDNVEQLYLTDLPANYYAFGVYYTNTYSGSVFYGLAWDLVPVPEPGTLLLVGSGLACLGLWRKYRQRRGRLISCRRIPVVARTWGFLGGVDPRRSAVCCGKRNPSACSCSGCTGR